MRILFVCTANICRSVMAEALLKHLLSGHRRRIDVDSAGIDIVPGLESDKFTSQVCSDHGLDISSHRPSQLTQQMLERSDIVLCLAENHRQLILGAYPRFESKVFLLKHFRQNHPVENPSVDDPIGRPLAHYEHCYSEIEEEVKRIAALLLHEEE